MFQANLYWQKSGAYLAVHTERYQKMLRGKDGEIKYTVTIVVLYNKHGEIL